MNTEEMERIKELRLKGMGYKAIASITGLSRDSVRGFCRRNGLIGVSAVVALNLEEKIKKNELCIYCEKPIKQKLQGSVRKFCSDECRYKWWNENLDKKNKSEEATYEFRLFNGTLHAGKIRSYIVLCLAISHQALTQKSASARRTHTDNEKYTFRCWLLRLGLIGEEFKNCRMHLMKALDGNSAWRNLNAA